MGEYGGVAPSFSLGSSRGSPGIMTPLWEALWGWGKALTCRGRNPGKGGFGELSPPSYSSLFPTGPDGGWRVSGGREEAPVGTWLLLGGGGDRCSAPAPGRRAEDRG